MGSWVVRPLLVVALEDIVDQVLLGDDHPGSVVGMAGQALNFLAMVISFSTRASFSEAP